MFTQRISLSAQDARKISATKLHRLGTVAETADGRVFRYARAGAVDLVAGKATTSAAKVANHTNNAVATAAAVNDRSVNITLAGATATTINQYNDGYLVVNDSAGVGSAYLIDGTPVIAASGTGRIVLAEGVATALTTSSKVSLQPGPWSDTIVSAAAAALFVDGVPNVVATATYYYWSQTGGVASVLSDGIITKGAGAIVSASVNGALTIELAATVTQRVGVAVEATVDTKYYPIYLTLE